jgi:hypothetical protein
VNNCPVCQQQKRPTKKYGEIPLSTQQYLPWQVCQIDLFGPWAFKDNDSNEHKLQALSVIDVEPVGQKLFLIPISVLKTYHYYLSKSGSHIIHAQKQ